MGVWIVIIVFGICTIVSFYMAFLGFSSSDSGAFLFASFGLFFGVLFLIPAIKALSKRSAFFKRIDQRISGKPEPVRFVPHWFMITAIIVTGLVIIVSIVMSIIRAVK